MMPTTFANEVFTTFISTDNFVAQLLLVHMFLVDYIIARFGFTLDQAPKGGGRKNVIISWIRNVAHVLPEDLKPYAPNTWTVPCQPKSNEVELDVVYNPDITDNPILINVYKYNNPRAQALQGNDPQKDLVFSFQAKGLDSEGNDFETSVFCNNCKNAAGVPVKC